MEIKKQNTKRNGIVSSLDMNAPGSMIISTIIFSIAVYPLEHTHLCMSR
jgi:hypothetical protein